VFIRKHPVCILSYIGSGNEWTFDHHDLHIHIQHIQHMQIEFVHQLLPAHIANAHQRWMKRAVQQNALPESLNHPLRNAQIRCKDGSFTRVHVSIGKLSVSLAACGLILCYIFLEATVAFT